MSYPPEYNHNHIACWGSGGEMDCVYYPVIGSTEGAYSFPISYGPIDGDWEKGQEEAIRAALDAYFMESWKSVSEPYWDGDWVKIDYEMQNPDLTECVGYPTGYCYFYRGEPLIGGVCKTEGGGQMVPGSLTGTVMFAGNVGDTVTLKLAKIDRDNVLVVHSYPDEVTRTIPELIPLEYELIASNNTPVTVEEPSGTLTIKELDIPADKQSGDYKVKMGFESPFPTSVHPQLVDQGDNELWLGFPQFSPWSVEKDFSRDDLTKLKVRRWESGNLPFTSTTFEVWQKTTCGCTEWQNAECISETQRKQVRTCTPAGCDIEERAIDDPSCAISCTCTPWQDAECISETQRRQVRTCTPAGCDIEERAIDDPSCAYIPPPPPDEETWWQKYGAAVAAVGVAVAGTAIFLYSKIKGKK